MRLLKKYFFSLLFLLPLTGAAQYYLTGQDPASVKWRQIRTPNFQIVFPEEYRKIAGYYANVLELSGSFVAHPYITKRRPLTIVLHNRSVLSNAMVSPAPFHADFFEMPSQDLYPQIWQNQLALHEYRHAVQMMKINSGFTKGLYYVFGQQAVAAVFGTFLPFWFIEGDAVFSETVHSRSGRGRVPEFTCKLKAQVLGKKIYKYDKAQFGSYNDFVPDHYTLGYQLVTCGIEKYGMQLWDKTLDNVARKPFTLVPFTHSLKKITGKGKVGFYNMVLDSLKVKWQSEDGIFNDSVFEVNNRFYSNYLFPQPLSDGSVICEKTGVDDINRFVKVFPDGNEKKIFTPGYDFVESLWANDSLICWNEKGFDTRWSNRSYSVIKIYNFKNRKLKTVTRKSRYFAPAVSHGADKIAVSEVDITGRYFLKIIDIVSGKVLKSYSTADNLFFMTPAWSCDDRYIVSVGLGKKGKSLLLTDTESGKTKSVMPFTYAEIKQPDIYGDFVVFVGTFEGKDELYALKIPDGKLFKLNNARFGSVNPEFSPRGKRIYYSAYTPDGYKPAVMNFDTASLKIFDGQMVHAGYPVDNLATPDVFVLDDVKVPDTSFTVEKYSRLAHLFNPYGWGPLYIDADNYTLNPGVFVLSQNKLSTAVSSLGYVYDFNEETGKLKFGFEYYGWYPVIKINTSYGGRRVFARDENGERQEVRWKESVVSASAALPLNFTRGRWIKGLKFSVEMQQKFLKMAPESKFTFKEDRTTAGTFQLLGYVQQKRSLKDIFPSYGIWINGLFRKTLFSDSSSRQTSLQGAVYLPGIIKHQGLRFYWALQNSKEGYYAFSETVSLPRGYTGLDFDKYAVLKFDYALPLFYPDWNIPAVSYLKRVYTRLYYDCLYDLKNGGNGGMLSSAGIEVYSGWHFLSLFPEVTLGIRYSRLIENGGNGFEFLYSVSF